MFKRITAVAALLAVTAAAFASDFTAPDEGFVSSRTRAAVQAEASQWILVEFTAPDAGFVSRKSRAEVQAEVVSLTTPRPVNSLYFGD